MFLLIYIMVNITTVIL